MAIAHPRLAAPRWLRLPRRTARLRLTAVYSALFLLTGAALGAITYVLFERATEYSTPAIPKIPPAPASEILKLPAFEPLWQNLLQDQFQLSQTLLQTRNHPIPGQGPTAPGQGQLATVVNRQLAQVQHQLAQEQHQLAQSMGQLTQSVHQLTQAGAVQAAQRAADAHQLLVNSGIALEIGRAHV